MPLGFRGTSDYVEKGLESKRAYRNLNSAWVAPWDSDVRAIHAMGKSATNVASLDHRGQQASQGALRRARLLAELVQARRLVRQEIQYVEAYVEGSRSKDGAR